MDGATMTATETAWDHLRLGAVQFEYLTGAETPIPPGFCTSWRSLPYLVLAQPALAPVWFFLEEREPVLVEPGAAICVAPGQRHRITDAAGQRNVSRWSHFNVWVLQSVHLAHLTPFCGVVHGAPGACLGDWNAELAALDGEAEGRRAWINDLRRQSIGLAMVATLLEALGAGRGVVQALPDIERLRPALDAIEAHPERAFGREELACLVHLSPSRFAAVFRSALGVAPVEYARRHQLRRAQVLLMTSRLGVEEVAVRCGYTSPAHFSRHFKARFGVSPLGYRKQARAAAGRGF